MIYKIPPLPKEIIEAVNNERLAVFIGAGISRLLGCKGWAQLANNLVETCFSLTKKDGSKLVNYKEKETLLKSNNYKKTITICYFLLKKNGFEKVFYDKFKESITADKNLLEKMKIYDELFKLRALFITTNADIYFDDKFEPTRIIYKKQGFNILNIDRNKLYKIHGTIGDGSDKYWDSLVFTVPQYIERYNISDFRDFLKKIFKEYTVLFVGYGLEEFELLDFLITKFDPEKKDKELKHFILLPFYQGEENILEFEKYYYNSMGIQVIAYEKDDLGYGQLYEVIKSWNRKINQTSAYLFDTYKQIEEFVNSYSQSNAEKVFQIIKNDEPQENYFFQQLAKTHHPFSWLKPLKEKGYFNPEKNPKPYEVPDNKGYYRTPHWNILDYLENVARENKEKPNDEITETLSEIVNQIINYRDEHGKRIENYRTDWVMLKIIFSLPIEKITEDHIEFIKVALNSKWDTTLVASEIGKTVLPILLEKKENALILKLLDVILSYKKIKQKLHLETKEVYEYTSIMDEYWLKKSITEHKPAIAKLCGIDAAKLAINKMDTIIKGDKSKFNNIWIPTIEDHPQTSFPDKYECQLVHFIRDMFELSEPQTIKKEIEKLLKKQHPIFKRIAIYIINYHYKDLNELFWNWKGNPLEENLLKHELYELLKNNCSSFNESQIDKVLEWIEYKIYLTREEIKEDKEKVEQILAYQKKEWLSALLETKNTEVLSLYKKYDEINPSELKHPGFNFWMETRWGNGHPELRKEFLNLTNEQIVEQLKNKIGNINKEDIADELRNAVIENPNKFTVNIKPFLTVSPEYQHALLWGFNEAWRLKKQIDWKVIFDFIFKLISLNDFWDKKYEVSNYRNWIISSIAELIENGTKDDQHAFPPKYLPKSEEILLLLAEKTESEITDPKDIITSVLNSAKGKVFSAMINYSLRYARLYKEADEEKWLESIKKDFTKRLNRNIEPSFEFSVILGKYLANLYWLDKKWVIENINWIFPKNNDIHWKAAFTSYLFYSSVVYKDIYFLLRENEHYAKAIKAEFSDSHITERFLQHVCIGYLENWENLEDEESLIFKLINNGNINQLSAIVSFFWMLRDKLTEKIKSKVKPIWEKLYELGKQNEESQEYKKLVSNLSMWTSLIDEIDDEIFEWLKLSSKYVDEDYNVPDFIEYLLKHVAITPKKVGELYIEMLNANIYPEYKEEYILQIVKTLYEKQEKEIANRICNLYGEKGYYFLKDMYYNYNKRANDNV